MVSTPSQSVALIYHFPLNAFLKGEEAEWSIVAVDITEGRRVGDQLATLRKETCREAFATVGEPPAPTVATDAPAVPTRDELRMTFAAMGKTEQQAARQYLRATHDVEMPAATDGQIIEAFASGRRITQPAAVEAPVRPVERRTPDEGASIPQGDVEAVRGTYAALGDEVRSWVSNAGEYIRLNPKSVDGKATVRRFEMMRALCALAGAGFDQDDTIRAIAAAIIGDDAWQTAPVADLVATLDVHEAKRFALTTDNVIDHVAPFEFPLDGRTVLVEGLAA